MDKIQLYRAKFSPKSLTFKKKKKKRKKSNDRASVILDFKTHYQYQVLFINMTF